MKRIILLLITFISVSFTLHKYYVSVLEFDLNADSQQLELSVKIFNDDWQNALDYRLGKPVLLGSKNEYPKLDSLVIEYFHDNISVEIDGNKKELIYLGSEMDGDATWVYLYIDSVASFSRIKIGCTLLTEMFDEQRNVVQIKKGDDIKSSLYTKSSNSKEFTFD